MLLIVNRMCHQHHANTVWKVKSALIDNDIYYGASLYQSAPVKTIVYDMKFLYNPMFYVTIIT